MSVPGFPSVISFYISQSEKGVFVPYVCTWLSLCPVFLLIASCKRLVLTYICTWLPFVIPFYLSHCEKRVCIWFSLCHVFLQIARRKGGRFLHTSEPGFQSVMSLILSEGEAGVVLDMCVYLVFPLSCLPTYRNVQKGWF